MLVQQAMGMSAMMWCKRKKVLEEREGKHKEKEMVTKKENIVTI
jgi:hypothetical protein